MTEKEFKDKLNPERYRVMRQKGTETPFTGKYWDSDEAGTYHCGACGAALFSSRAKFDAGTGWPSFRKPLDLKKISVTAGREAICAACASHLGEIVEAGEKSGYYRINSISLDFKGSKLPGILEDLQEKAEELIEEEEKERAAKDQDAKTAPKISLKNILVLLGAALMGGGLGGAIVASYSALMCQTSASVQVFAPFATSAPAVAANGINVPPASVVTAPAGGAAATPRSTTSVSAATGTPAAATTSQSSADGTLN